MADMLFGLGALPSPPDPKDYQIESILAAGPIVLPAKYQVWNSGMVPPVLNQGQTPMCVAFASTGMKLWQERPEARRFLDLNEEWLYRECKKIDGIPDADGTFVRVAMKVLKNKGIPSAGFFARDAAKHRISAYYSVPKDVNTIKLAIRQYGPVVIATTWYQSWFKLAADGRLPRPDEQAGGHATLLWGWDDTRRVFYVRNSWGPKWGLNGNFLLPYDYLKYSHDLWKAVDLPDGLRA